MFSDGYIGFYDSKFTLNGVLIMLGLMGKHEENLQSFCADVYADCDFRVESRPFFF